MAATKQLLLTTVEQDIIVQSVTCQTVLIKEDESVVGWWTTPIIVKKPDTNGTPNTYSGGKAIMFQAPQGGSFGKNQVLGRVYLPSGSTTGIQDES